MLLPLFWPSQVAEIGEEEVHVKVEVGMKVVRLYVQLSPEQNDIVHFDLLLAVSNEESLAQEARVLVNDLRGKQVVVVGSLLGRLS